MGEQRLIIEMGMGNDLHGQDYTKAAARAIEDAFRHSSLPIFGATGMTHDQMRVQVTVGVQEPDKVDVAVLANTLPRGRAEVHAVKGGLNVDAGGETIVVAQASIEAFLPPQTGWRLKKLR
ncbi:Lin0512 family protein [Sulfitobacter aestuariivivens]|uniref:Lin0512 family protein n=1 Tax=Sulfitobacter aestuariivivens TaxID=2766981 RepID=A0A927HE56_9RHOB|nr:Lin0512 family protein [Sulfitobacter aestuariivivens]MBD3663536.1 Lin0512 family protein [Sulfitobacter aestuariivivens]